MQVFCSWFMVFNATFNNISVILWRSVLLVEETGIPRENHERNSLNIIDDRQVSLTLGTLFMFLFLIT